MEDIGGGFGGLSDTKQQHRNELVRERAPRVTSPKLLLAYIILQLLLTHHPLVS